MNQTNIVYNIFIESFSTFLQLRKNTCQLFVNILLQQAFRRLFHIYTKTKIYLFVF